MQKKRRSLEVDNSVIVGPEGHTGNIRIKVSKEKGTHEESSDPKSTTSIHDSVVVGAQGQTGNITVSKQKRR